MFLSVLLPARCAGCGMVGSGLCPQCAGGLTPPPSGPPPPGLDACWSLFSYGGVGRLVVTNLKYRRDRSALAALAAGMAALLPPPPRVVVTWAPTTAARRRQRGFDQAELLARAVARCWGAPCHPLLSRRAGPPQTGRSLADRRAGPLLLARAGSRVAAGAPVVVVDDVVTTGSTLAAAARALQAVDVAWVAGLTAARTPGHDAAPPGASGVRHTATPPSVIAPSRPVRGFAQVRGGSGR
jgi:predicted amidophosphoribosyltransferase